MSKNNKTTNEDQPMKNQLKQALDEMKRRPANSARSNAELSRILALPHGGAIKAKNIERFMDGQMDAISESEAVMLMSFA